MELIGAMVLRVVLSGSVAAVAALCAIAPAPAHADVTGAPSAPPPDFGFVTG